MMASNFNDPLEVDQNGQLQDIYFTQRQKTGMHPKSAESHILPLAKNSINYNDHAWQNFPIIDWFY